MAVTESLMDYKESMSSNDEGSRVSHSSSGGEEVFPKGSEDDCSTDGGEEVPCSTARHGKGKVSYTRKDKGKSKQRESTPKLKCFLCDGPHLTRECPKRKGLNTLIEKSEKTMEDARLGSIQMIGPPGHARGCWTVRAILHGADSGYFKEFGGYAFPTEQGYRVRTQRYRPSGTGYS